LRGGWGEGSGGRLPVSESNPYLLEIAFGFGISLPPKMLFPKTHALDEPYFGYTRKNVFP